MPTAPNLQVRPADRGEMGSVAVASLPEPTLGVDAWHPDPTGRHELRWWGGRRRSGGTGWSDQVCDGDDVSSDPLPDDGF